jgi:hypothetical protein
MSIDHVSTSSRADENWLSTSTGNVRPGTFNNGAIVPSPAVEKYFWNLSASSVADMTTILRSFRRLASSLSRPEIGLQSHGSQKTLCSRRLHGKW